MDKPCFLGSQILENFSHWENQVNRKGPRQLPPHPCRVGQRPKNVEDGFASQFLAHGHDMFDRGVMHRGHHKADANFIDGTFCDFGTDHDIDPQGGQRICGP